MTREETLTEILNFFWDTSAYVILRNEVTKNLFSSLPSFCHSEEQSDEKSVFYRYCEDPSLTLRMTR